MAAPRCGGGEGLLCIKGKAQPGAGMWGGVWSGQDPQPGCERGEGEGQESKVKTKNGAG